MDNEITMTEANIGCHLDNHRGHYITRDAIQLAQLYGFMIGPFEEYAVSMYDSANEGGSEVDYPHEALQELCDEAVAWLNSGQGECDKCAGTGINWTEGEYYTRLDQPDIKRCLACSGTGRGDRIKHQKYPPRIPEGTTWAFEDGDFGLYRYDDDGNVTE